MWIAALIGMVWGLAEGTFFFLIPDIALSFIALKGWKPALAATISVVIGAMIGAIFIHVYLNTSADPAAALVQLKGFWAQLPGYYEKMFDVAREHLSSSGAQGLIKGPNSGIPYRFYVVEAYEQHLPLGSLLLWTPIARLERILLAPVVVLVLRFVAGKLRRRFPYWTEKRVTLALGCLIALYWVGVYVWYWGSFLPSQYGAS